MVIKRTIGNLGLRKVGMIRRPDIRAGGGFGASGAVDTGLRAGPRGTAQPGVDVMAVSERWR